ncbi:MULTISPECIES: PA2169 family four-helix-bundle protein [unclassified Leeuwenhoekiella]|uniref:ferritin-like domain-containing protein n=1 Tax=unclassified Leeuwenhoekiella TaxID=2615029 RepID=UPI000C3E354E|nr:MULTISPECIES: PA2169 family four-helix-bundle protein [unclassified Leeuwenhoekiella]MAW95228.1 hypothetical protein [Leeuwenhoekiella sp.]MBA81849.1 hypothetical protein [Leeuwenhoekiella sp.]|tara:strand:+ start:2093 stop:2557 length:465 start_codon:yes stop_codon:yes gene_type:complete
METTSSHEKITKGLQRLLVKNYDAEKGYITAMQDIDHAALRGFMQRQAAKRNSFATELDHELHLINEKPESDGSLAGSLHRTWMDLRDALNLNDKSAILEECLRGEETSAKEYEQVLEEIQFPQHLRTVINNQLSKIYRTIEDLQQLEDITKLQ